MESSFGWTVFLYTLSLSITLTVFFFTVTKPWVQGARIFAWVMLSEAIWILGNIFELLSPSLEAKIFWDHVQYVPATAMSLWLLAFSLIYAGPRQQQQQRRVTPWLTGIGLILAVLLLLVLTNGMQGGLRPGARLAVSGSLVVLTYPFNLFDYLVTGYVYLLTIVGLILLVRLAVRQPALLQPQTFLLIAGYAMPVIGSIFSLFNIVIGPQRDSSPLFMAFGNLLVWIGLFRYRLFNMLSAARVTAVEHIHDALIVLDHTDRIVDLNPAAQALLRVNSGEVTGLPAQQVLPPAVQLHLYPRTSEAHNEVRFPTSLESETSIAHYELHQIPLFNRRQQAMGRLLVLHDITVRKHNEDIQRQVNEERILRQGEAKFHMVIDQFTEGFVLIDSTGCVNEWNRAQEEITGITHSEAHGRLYWEIMEQLTVPERRSPGRTTYYRQAVLDTLKTGHLSAKPTTDAQIMCADGQRKYIQQTAFPVRIGDTYWIGSATRDNTPEKKAQLALERYVARLKIWHEIDRAILAAERPTGVVSAALEGIRQFVQFHGAGVALVEPLPDGTRCLASEGEPPCFDRVPASWLNFFENHPDQKMRVETKHDDPQEWPVCARCIREQMGKADQRLVVALLSQGHVMGVLYLCLNLPAVFTHEVIEIVLEVGDQLAIALQQETLLDQTQRRLHELTTLHEIAILLNYQGKAHNPLGELTEHIAHLLGARRCILVLRDEHNFFRAYNPAYGLSETEVASIAWQPPEDEQKNPLWSKGYLIATRKEDLNERTEHFFQQLNLENLLAVSLWRENQVLGLIVVCDKAGGFRKDDIQLLTVVASQAAQMIINTHLFQQLSDAYDATITGWSKALELREKETQNHSERVTSLAFKLAQRMGMSEAELDDFSRGVLLHDIGKMGIPDDILLKPGPLDSAQWEVMRRHPGMAYELLKNISFLQQALVVPYNHHERWDGSGYPRGLRAEEIPLSARMFAVVDVWDALTNDRPYRKAWSAAETRAYLLENAGKLFDPHVVEMFLSIVEE